MLTEPSKEGRNRKQLIRSASICSELDRRAETRHLTTFRDLHGRSYIVLIEAIHHASWLAYLHRHPSSPVVRSVMVCSCCTIRSLIPSACDAICTSVSPTPHCPSTAKHSPRIRKAMSRQPFASIVRHAAGSVSHDTSRSAAEATVSPTLLRKIAMRTFGKSFDRLACDNTL